MLDRPVAEGRVEVRMLLVLAVPVLLLLVVPADAFFRNPSFANALAGRPARSETPLSLNLDHPDLAPLWARRRRRTGQGPTRATRDAGPRPGCWRTGGESCEFLEVRRRSSKKVRVPLVPAMPVLLLLVLPLPRRGGTTRPCSHRQ